MQIVYRKVDELIPYVNNPRNNEEAVTYVAKSIKEFGFKVPIVIDKHNEIVAGHTRLLASKKLELEEVPCIVADDSTDEQVRAFRLADNKVSEFATWDMAALDYELNALSLSDLNFNMKDFGFEELEEFSSDEVIEDDFDETLPEKAITKPGDVYQLGRHRLMCGDSTKEEDVLKLVGGVLVDMFLTDPPYNVSYEGKTKDKLTIQNDKMEDQNFRTFLVDAFTTADSVMKPGSVFYIWHADSEGFNFRGACQAVNWKVRQCLIWNKNSMVIGRQDYHWKHEPCLYGWKDGAGHLWASDRKQTTILNFDRPNRNGEHPTMKPVSLFDYQIRNNTKEMDIVLDLFSGSGTTIIACEQNGRVGYGMELEPKYCDVIVRRWEELTGNKAVLLNE